MHRLRATTPVRSIAIRLYAQLCHRYLYRNKWQISSYTDHMKIRCMTRADVRDLIEILRAVGPHGHREWPTEDETQLVRALNNPRLDPNSGGWSIAFEHGAPLGYSLVEEELNIGRIIIGVATLPSAQQALPPLLKHSIEHALAACEDEFELHLAIRDSEPAHVTEAVKSAHFKVVSTVLKMRVPADTCKRKPVEPYLGVEVDELDIHDFNAARAVTDLHNACFSGSWGFSPNTVDEISARAIADAERCGFSPILVARDRDNVLVAYIWTTMNDWDGRIEMVGVRPAARGTGLGWFTFNAGVEHLLMHGAQTLSLDVHSQNQPARRIYESAGFKTYQNVRYYGRSFGKS